MTAQTIAQIKQFVADGGTVIAIANPRWAQRSTFGLPVTNQLVENDTPLPREKFYVPGAVLRMTVDENNPLAHGLGKEIDVFFDNDPVFKLGPDAASKGVHSVGWFADAAPLRSGWAWGRRTLDKGVQVIDATSAEGRAVPDGSRSAVPVATARQLQAVLQRPVSVGRARADGRRPVIGRAVRA